MAIQGMAEVRMVRDTGKGDPESDMPGPTELARLYERFAQSNSRMRDMLGVMEGRLDFVTGGGAPQAAETTGGLQRPPASPGTVSALHELADGLHNLCNRFDDELCRMTKIL